MKPNVQDIDDTSDTALTQPQRPSWTDEDGPDFISDPQSRVLSMTRAESDKFKQVILSELATAGADRAKACEKLGITTRELRLLEDEDPDFKLKVSEVLQADNMVLADKAREALHRLISTDNERTLTTVALYLDKTYGTEANKAANRDGQDVNINIHPVDSAEIDQYKTQKAQPKGDGAPVHAIKDWQ